MPFPDLAKKAKNNYLEVAIFSYFSQTMGIKGLMSERIFNKHWRPVYLYGPFLRLIVLKGFSRPFKF